MFVSTIMATVLITGGTGLIGHALTKVLTAKGYNIIILTRNAKDKKAAGNVSYAEWNITNGTIDTAAIKKADYIIHLAGAGVAESRWTEKRKKEIVDSRVQSSKLLVKALTENTNHVKAVISASAIGWYGGDPQIPNPKPFVETAPHSNTFLGNTCQQWEDSTKPLIALGKRLVHIRTGIVLSNDGGAFVEFKKPLQFGAATVLGNGKQIVSWVHINDIVGIYIHAIENENMQGPYNAVAPLPVSNEHLIKTIAKQKGGFYVTTHVPQIVLKAALGEMSIEVLKSATVSSKKIEAAGYNFMFNNIETAVHNLIKKAS